MTATLQGLKEAASQLPAADRAELARFLLDSLDDADDSWADAWRVELARRLEEMRSGKVKGVAAAEVLARLRERYP